MLVVNRSGTFRHRLRRVLKLGIRDNVSEAVAAYHLHAKSVKTYAHSAVLWCAAFLVWLAVFGPWLLAARADGQPG